ncbi:MAG TPA: tail fiber domain-containing protein [Flavobacteriales bacterium]|nr:tail fiber domain-containing protein [Flavobacteriales bacterium]HNE79659.1 tail fiber domain-containing protein [Flavobacteriales bacterium]HNK67450.1 tail fiber domain-containing protein [Flavobacteriales bacterium]HNK85246.1 tail fiber domain-containing protein [Flavobacteriales bacterium]
MHFPRSIKRDLSDLVSPIGFATGLTALFALTANAQTGVAIGTGSPTAHASAMLDVQSTNKGMLVPRMTSAQRTAIASPAAGLLVFDTTLGQFHYYTGGSWQAIAPGSGFAWSVTGNAGINPDTQFIGTTDDQPIIMKQNGQRIASLKWDNIAFGTNSLQATTTGTFNFAMGNDVGTALTTGNHNVMLGDQAMREADPDAGFNTVVGCNAGKLITGNWNTVMGSEAGHYAGSKNVAVGTLAGYSGDAGNTCLGYDAGPDVAGASNCVFVGNGSTSSTLDLTNSIAIGYNRTVIANNQVRIGNTSMTSIGGQVGWSTLSDARTKKNVNANVHGLDFILKLRPVTYNYDMAATIALNNEGQRTDPKTGKTEAIEPTANDQQARDAQGRVTYTGFIAQEVEQAAKEVGYDFSGVDAPKNADDLYSLRYAEFTVPLVKAVQEQQAMIDAQQQLITDLQRRLQQLEAR